MGTARMHLRSLGAAALVAVVAVATVSPGDASAGKVPELPKGPKIKTDQPCTLIGEKQLEEVLEPTVAVDEGNEQSPIGSDCAWVIGHTDAPEARLVGVVVYPGFTAPGSNALDVVENDRANAQISGPGVVDLPLGKGGFVEKPRSLLEVAANKRFAFSLQWYPSGGAPEGSPITDEVRSLLTTLATDVARRGKRVGS